MSSFTSSDEINSVDDGKHIVGGEVNEVDQDLVEKTTGLSVSDEGSVEGEENTYPIIEKNLDLANEAKEEGNSCFRTKDYDNAISMYSRAIVLCPTDDEHKETLAVFYGNRAAAYFSVDEYECVVDDCSSALNLKPSYPKVLMRRSQAYEKLNRAEDALADAKKTMELDPSYPKIGAIVQRLEKGEFYVRLFELFRHCCRHSLGYTCLLTLSVFYPLSLQLYFWFTSVDVRLQNVKSV